MRKLMVAGVAVAVLALAAVTVGGAATSADEGDGPIGTFLEKLAGKLGVSEDELTTALQDTQLEMIDEAVAEGRMTEEQAERLRERVEDGGILFPPRPDQRFHPGPGVCQRAARGMVDAAAEVLDMPKDELVKELKDGASLAEVAEAQGMEGEEFTEALLDQVQSQLDGMVDDGKLTEEQAERIFQRAEDNIDRIVNGHPGPKGPCPPKRGPGPRGFGGPEHGAGGLGGPPPGPFNAEPEAAELSDVTA